VQPTPKAIDAITLVSKAIKAAEADWARVLGADRLAEFRSVLFELRDRGDRAGA